MRALSPRVTQGKIWTIKIIPLIHQYTSIVKIDFLAGTSLREWPKLYQSEVIQVVSLLGFMEYAAFWF